MPSMKRTTLALALISVAAIGVTVSAQRGRKPVNWKDLPAPFATPSVRNNATVVPKPDGASLGRAAGICRRGVHGLRGRCARAS